MVESRSEDFGRSVGAEIRYWRNRRGLTQEQLAELVGIGVNTIIRYEGGGNGPNPVVAWKIADALEVSLSQLIARAEHSLGADISVVVEDPTD